MLFDGTVGRQRKRYPLDRRHDVHRRLRQTAGMRCKYYVGFAAKIASLPDETLVYCGHDYTLENYEFANIIEPGNQIVKERLEQIKQLQAQGKPTVPSNMLQEKTTNCFLRAGTPELKAALGMQDAPAVEAFAELRRRKDVF